MPTSQDMVVRAHNYTTDYFTPMHGVINVTYSIVCNFGEH